MVEGGQRPDQPDIVRQLLKLAELHLDADKLNLAQALYRRALEIAEQIHGPRHPDVARCLNGLASLLWKTNRLKEAEAALRRALAIDEKKLGPRIPTWQPTSANWRQSSGPPVAWSRPSPSSVAR